MLDTKPVAEAHGVRVHCPLKGRYSFFNSPYPAHQLHTGVDIYPGGRFGEDTFSPVTGVVTEIRRVKAPAGRGFKDAGHDTLILIEADENPTAIVKLLHIDPMVSVGDRVSQVDPIGSMIRSGYYGWGTSPHIHVEVRRKEDPLRARGGYLFKRIITPIAGEATAEIVGEVVYVQPEYAFIKLSQKSYGLQGEVNSVSGVLDGGIPYYGWLGVHLDEPNLGEIRLLGRTIADVIRIYPGSCIANTREFNFTLNDKPILGLSLYLTPIKQPIVKILPRKIGALNVEEGQVIEIKIEI